MMSRTPDHLIQFMSTAQIQTRLDELWRDSVTSRRNLGDVFAEERLLRAEFVRRARNMRVVSRPDLLPAPDPDGVCVYEWRGRWNVAVDGFCHSTHSHVADALVAAAELISAANFFNNNDTLGG